MLAHLFLLWARPRIRYTSTSSLQGQVAIQSNETGSGDLQKSVSSFHTFHIYCGLLACPMWINRNPKCGSQFTQLSAADLKEKEMPKGTHQKKKKKTLPWRCHCLAIETWGIHTLVTGRTEERVVNKLPKNFHDSFSQVLHKRHQ